MFSDCFEKSSLSKTFEKMIIEEDQKNEEKNEKLRADLCECYLMVRDNFFSSDFVSKCVPCILKIALNKEEREETRKEVEIALVALSNIGKWTRNYI
ncbi:uncharacterized protein MONOS_17012 [Monocercomonoides exilis]|uniref:uncharacterized protein n=1 Tax=Monocercomonoides exilis TaxID=2049356 RepID=UPI003559E0CA|nr:hypothetical protein MONOS_17012 [Monocercomonoides exilis]